MKNVNKLLSVVLTLCMNLSLLPMTALAAPAPLTVGTGGDYTTIADALVNAADGDTILLLNDITESVSYTVTTGKTITIDGDGFTITGVDGTSSAALSLDGAGDLIIKDIKLLVGLGGSASSDASKGLYVSGTLNVYSIGTVTATGGTDKYSCGLYHNGSGAVNLTNATGRGYGVNNNSTGTVNVTSATATGGATYEAYGMFNNSSGTVNVTTSTASGKNNGCGVVNFNSGTVNVTTAVGNVIGVYNSSSGTVNAANISGSTTGTFNTGTNVAIITLNKGTDASCVLDSITVAASGSTTIGALPSVYMNEEVGEWYTDVDKTALFSGTAVTAETTLYSTFCTSISGTILDSVTSAGFAATLQLRDCSGNNVGNAVTAAADGSYTISNVPAGTGYTILVTKSGYADGIITAFDVSDTNVTALNLTLHSLTVGTGGNTLTDALASAGDGDTITLLNDITESVSYTGTADKTITIDGGNCKITGGVDLNYDFIALSLSGAGTVILKNLTLQGGSDTENYCISTGLDVSGEINVRSLGTVSVNGGTCYYSSYGVSNRSTGTVDVTTATASDTNGCGVYSASGTINVVTAQGLVGVQNGGLGTINVTTSIGTSLGVKSSGDGTINATTINGGVWNIQNGTVNVTTINGYAQNDSTYGRINAGIITGSTYGTGINTGTEVAAVTLNKGTGTSCVLDSITVAASGDTTIGTLPSVYKNGVFSST